MTALPPPSLFQMSLFRTRSADGHHRVTYAELFFDLVFVFAVTQVSHSLLAARSAREVVQVGVLGLAVWWAWVFTSWITNWLDPDRPGVRFMLFALMLAGLGLSTSLPGAFGERGIVFAASYVAAQVGRTAFMCVVIPRRDAALRRNFIRILVWLVVGGVFWIAGAFRPSDERLFVWGVALAIEYVGPIALFWTPGLGASDVRDWSVEGGHMAERAALFVIIALGESLLVTGATFAEGAWASGTILGFAAAFVASLAMWWIYFDRGVELGAARITQAAEPGRLARLAYTYLHLPIVAGVVLSAVADELVLHHPDGPAHGMVVVATVGGPLAFLIGVLLFKRAVNGRLLQLSHLVGVGLLAVLFVFAAHLSPVHVSLLASGVLTLVAVWEWISLRGQSEEPAHGPAGQG